MIKRIGGDELAKRGKAIKVAGRRKASFSYTKQKPRPLRYHMVSSRITRNPSFGDLPVQIVAANRAKAAPNVLLNATISLVKWIEGKVGCL